MESTLNRKKIVISLVMKAVLVSLLILITGCNDKEDTKYISNPREPFDVITMECSNVSLFAAELHGLALYNSHIILQQIAPEISFCYSKLPNPDIKDSIASRVRVTAFENGYADSSAVSAKIEQLAHGTTYYYRIFARTNDWIRYGEVMTFTTEDNNFKIIITIHSLTQQPEHL